MIANGANPHRPRDQRRRRRGFSLLESVVSISIGIVLTTIAIALIVAALASYARSRDHFQDTLILDQLAAQFRADARAASAAATSGKPRPETEIDLQMTPQERVVYEIEPSGDGLPGCFVRRTRYRQDVVVGRDGYALRYFGLGRFAVDSPEDASIAPAARQAVRLTLARQTASWVSAERGDSSAREVSLQGTIGRDRRFESEER